MLICDLVDKQIEKRKVTPGLELGAEGVLVQAR